VGDVMPGLGRLRRYDRSFLRLDLVAGFTLWGLLVPEMIAYAGLAGLPPEAGLYTLLASLALYALFGTSRHLVVAGTSASAVLVFATVSELSPADPSEFAAYAAALVLLTGLVFVLAGVLRLGFLADFLSRPVMAGFVFGLALFVAVRQLPKLLGIEGGSGNSVEQFIHLLGNLGDTNGATLVVGVAALAVLFGLAELAPRLPAGLVVLVAGIGASAALDLSERGVAIVGQIPSGLPSPSLPGVGLADLWILVPGAVGMMLVIYSETLGGASAFAEKHGYRLDPDQELVALGAANVGSGLLGGLAAGGSLSQTAVNDGAGAKTQVSTLFAALLSLVTVLALTGLFEELPEAVLAALIIHAVTHLMKVGELRRFARLDRTELWLALMTLGAVLVFEVLPALILGIVVSLVLVIGRASRPHTSILGVEPTRPGTYVDVDRHPGAVAPDGVVVVRPVAALFYANAQAVGDAILAAAEHTPSPRAVVVDLDASDTLDITSAEHLVKVARTLGRSGVAVHLVNVHQPAREMAEATGLLELVGVDQVFASIEAAVAAGERRDPPPAPTVEP
jgi:high affinity sulfate transporter 1